MPFVSRLASVALLLASTGTAYAQQGPAATVDPTDIADVSDYTLLVNGLPTARKPFFEMKKGEKVRLRFINGSAMSFMDVRVPGLSMTVIAADGRAVAPVKVDEFRMAVAETYDVLVEPTEDRAYPLWVETIDRRANALAVLGPTPGMPVEAPRSRPKQILMMSEMGHAMGQPALAETSHASQQVAATDPDTAILNAAAERQPHATPDMAGSASSCTPEHAAMGYCSMPAAPEPAPKSKCSAEHAAMGHCAMPEPVQPPPAQDESCPPEHAAMGHCTPKPPAPSGAGRIGTAVPATIVEGGTPFPRVDYGYGADPMAGMDHSKMNHAMTELAREGDVDGSGRVFGWATGAPYGARVLSMRDLWHQPPMRMPAPLRARS